eukprot:5507654-Pyramimonas_sp.AAC.1
MGGRGRMSDMTRAHLACPPPPPASRSTRAEGPGHRARGAPGALSGPVGNLGNGNVDGNRPT